MMKANRVLLLLTICVLLFLNTDLTKAGVGTVHPLGNSGWSMIVTLDGSEPGEVAAPYVYDVTGNEVIIQIDKKFTQPIDLDWNTFSPIIIDFRKDSASAVQNIVINDERVQNLTGTEWFDYHMFLLVDAIDPQAGFASQYIPDGDQLEDVSYSVNSGYSGLPIQLNFVNAVGGGVPSNTPGSDTFRPGSAGGSIVIVTDPTMEVGETFGLKEFPTIPEPATILIFGAGGMFIILKRKK